MTNQVLGEKLASAIASGWATTRGGSGAGPIKESGEDLTYTSPLSGPCQELITAEVIRKGVPVVMKAETGLYVRTYGKDLGGNGMRLPR